jgi:hypothetical protein
LIAVALNHEPGADSLHAWNHRNLQEGLVIAAAVNDMDTGVVGRQRRQLGHEREKASGGYPAPESNLLCRSQDIPQGDGGQVASFRDDPEASRKMTDTTDG